MLSRHNLEMILGTVRTAAASMEARFLEIGNRLEIAIDVLGSLARTFERLSDELCGENLAEATQTLSQIMSRIATVADAHASGRDTVTELAALAASLKRRVAGMGKAVAGIRMLAMNARIEAASIGDSGHEFVTFAGDIARTLRLARISLTNLNCELDGLSSELSSAAASQLALARLQTTAAKSIPLQLDASIAAIKDRVHRAVETTSTVMEKFRQVGHHINKAVAALQIGDATHQRLDHVEYALGLVTEILAPAHDPSRSKYGDWTGLAASQRPGLAILCCRLQSAQLIDAADQLDQETRHIKASMASLTTDAREILRLGTAAAGGSDQRRGSFLGQIEEQVTDVSKLLNSLGKARRQTDHVTRVVAEATTRLVDHTGALTAIESDIRMMGLNTSLKCGRLGSTGRPLMVIAQELRTYANQIALDASAVTTSLDTMVQATQSLLSNGHPEAATDITGVASVMAKSVSRLETTGQTLSSALGALGRDAANVSKLLMDTAARATTQEELSDVLRQAAIDLTTLIAEVEDPGEPPIQAADTMLLLLSRGYTMDRERAVHNQSAGGRYSAIVEDTEPAQSDAPAAESLEDIFF